MTQNKKTVIGITGNTGSGKTTVANMLCNYGGHAIDADVVSRKLMEPEGAAYKPVTSVFGPEILKTDGEIDRKKLGQIVFNDVKKRTMLENIIHPLVTEEILKQIENSDSPVVSLDAVLLVESGLYRHCSAVWLVIAPAKDRLARIIDRDGLSHEDAEARMRNQRDTADIEKIAQAIIYNDGDFDGLKSQIYAMAKTFSLTEGRCVPVAHVQRGSRRPCRDCVGGVLTDRQGNMFSPLRIDTALEETE